MSIKMIVDEYIADMLSDTFETETVALTVRMPVTLRDRIQRIASETSKSQSTVCSDLLEAGSLEFADELVRQMSFKSAEAARGFYHQLAYGKPAPEVSNADA